MDAREITEAVERFADPQPTRRKKAHRNQPQRKRSAREGMHRRRLKGSTKYEKTQPKSL